MARLQADKTTLMDLSLFAGEESGPVMRFLDYAVTGIGKEQLRRNLSTPLPSVEEIIAVQRTISTVMSKMGQWPVAVTNGTIMVIEKFLETPIDPIPGHVGKLNEILYRWLHKPDHSLAVYSASHCLDLIRGLSDTVRLLSSENNPEPLRNCLDTISGILNHTELEEFARLKQPLSKTRLLQVAGKVRFRFKNEMRELLEWFGKIDGWYGMAKAVDELKLCFPVFTESDKPLLEVKGLYHLLVKNPVQYDLQIGESRNFIFLTGANMSGKSTFIKSIGTAAFLAHTGMGVPASSFRISFLTGLISNINVTDDITRGESYFFNEVRRIKSTLSKLSEGGRWMVLIDELFKGTNMQDAMKCSLAVIEGLSNSKNSIFILSTHLYEIAKDLEARPNIMFFQFETDITPQGPVFHYKLREGISQDRIGFRILEQEGVMELLKNLT